jgi:hypothetical protein
VACNSWLHPVRRGKPNQPLYPNPTHIQLAERELVLGKLSSRVVLRCAVAPQNAAKMGIPKARGFFRPWYLALGTWSAHSNQKLKNRAPKDDGCPTYVPYEGKSPIRPNQHRRRPQLLQKYGVEGAHIGS